MFSVAKKWHSALYTGAILGIWLVIFVLSLLSLFQGELSRIKQEFDALASNLHSELRDRTALYETSLEGFADFLSTMPELDLDRSRYYVRQWLAHYPEIYMMEVAKRVSHEERTSLVQQMREAGYSDFEIHTFGYETDRETHLSPEKPVYYPIVFIEPELPQALGVLGLDLADTSSTLKHALERSYALQTLVASEPFDLIEDRRGYVLYRPIVEVMNNALVELKLEQELYALIVIDTSTLIPDEVKEHPRLILTLSHTNGSTHGDHVLIRVDNSVEPVGILDNLLPTLEDRRILDSPSQPFSLDLQYQVGWNAFTKQRFLVFSTAAVITLLIALLCERILYKRKLQKDSNYQRLARLANYDTITGLPNRILLLDRLEQAIRHGKRNQTSFVVMFIDLNDFKSINDRHGHNVGDKVLNTVGMRLSRLMRDEDTVARIHGDEYVVLLGAVSDDDAIEKIVAKVKSSFLEPITVDRDEILVSMGIGCAVYPDDGESADALLATSDRRMYKEKRKRHLQAV